MRKWGGGGGEFSRCRLLVHYADDGTGEKETTVDRSLIVRASAREIVRQTLTEREGILLFIYLFIYSLFQDTPILSRNTLPPSHSRRVARRSRESAR